MSETPTTSETSETSETSVTVDVETLAVAVADLRPALEAILMVADQALDKVQLASVVGHPVEAVHEALQALAGEYTEQGRGFELRNVAGGWRFYTRDEFAGVVESFVLEGQQARLTQAALETLAVVAYKQPVSRARVSAVRGVSVDGVMRTLLTRGLVEEAGQDVDTGANLYRTTTYFLDRIGITSLDELPELAPYLPDMEDLEDELTQMAAPAPEPTPEPAPPSETENPQHAPPPSGVHQAPPSGSHHSPPSGSHHSPHSGLGTEPDGGTEIA